ncbi:MAG: hypothetical protein Q7S86_01960 [bacterium]|nr:hypothetical protein [bacterium]
MRIFHSASFRRDFFSLPKDIRVLADKKLTIFGDNPRHPSLRTKKMEGIKNIWEGRITDAYRFTFSVEHNVAILRRIGTHDILRKESGR